VIVAHRLQENDLCGHVLEDGDDWTKIVLPFEATRLAVFDLGHGKKWRRKKGELLRTGEFSERVRKRLRTLRNFQALYQQNPGGSALPKISAKHFPLQPLVDNERVPTVISIDPGQAEGERNSHSVVQVWRVRPTGYFLVDQWRGRDSYGKLRSTCKSMILKHRPCVALIEKAGTGVALLSDLQQFGWMERMPIVPRATANLPGCALTSRSSSTGKSHSRKARSGDRTTSRSSSSFQNRNSAIKSMRRRSSSSLWRPIRL